MKTFSTRPSDVRREWHVIDATEQSLGRLSTQVALYLRGKHKPIYTPHLDVGDFVIVVNAAKVRLTGRKLEQKQYYHHSGYPGGLKVRGVKQELETRPERVIERAVRGMLPKGSLGLHLFNHLKVYAGPDHPHMAQIRAAVAPFTAPPPGSGTPNAPDGGGAAALAPTVAIAPPEAQLPAATDAAVPALPPAELAPPAALPEPASVPKTEAVAAIEAEGADQPPAASMAAIEPEMPGEPASASSETPQQPQAADDAITELPEPQTPAEPASEPLAAAEPEQPEPDQPPVGLY